MRSYQAGELLLAETATSAGTTSERAQNLLEVLRRIVPFDGAWLALADPPGHGYHPPAPPPPRPRLPPPGGPRPGSPGRGLPVRSVDGARHRGHRRRPGTAAVEPVGL